MAITAALIFAGHNSLRYLVTATVGGGESVNINSSGGVSPDVQTDALGGQLKAIAKANDLGYGKLAAGSQSIANTRALLMGDDSAALVGAGNRPICALAQLTGCTPGRFLVDAKADGTYGLTVTALDAGTCRLEIFVPGAIGS